MIQYYIDGSTKENQIGAGIVRVDGFGFIEKHHFNVEHINPSSTIAEGYALEKTLELIKGSDTESNELIDIFTDYQSLYQSFSYNENEEFKRNNFFKKDEGNPYFLHLRGIYVELISKFSSKPIYHCEKTKSARPMIKLFFKNAVKDKRYLQEAHSLSRKYIDDLVTRIELKAKKDKKKWYIIQDDNMTLAENARPLVALSDALSQIDTTDKQIILCDKLETFLKNINKSKLSNESMKSAVKTIEKHKSLMNL